MSAKYNAKLTELTAGELKYISSWELAINDVGKSIDFTGLTFENSRTKANHLIIINDGGTNDVYVAFDSTTSAIDTADGTTFNFKVYGISPYTEIELDGEANKISLKCASGLSTTVKILVW